MQLGGEKTGHLSSMMNVWSTPGGLLIPSTSSMTRLISSVFLVFPYRNPPAHGEDAGSRGGTGRSLLGVSAVQGLVHGPGR